MLVLFFFCICIGCLFVSLFFFFNDTATTEIYTLSLHDALPIYPNAPSILEVYLTTFCRSVCRPSTSSSGSAAGTWRKKDRKSTRLNSSHGYISYAVFCLKKKKKENDSTGCFEDKRRVIRILRCS